MSPAFPLGISIICGGFLALIAFQIMRGVRTAKRERARLEALIQRVAEHSCPLCGIQYGVEVRSEIRISFTDDDQLPAHMAKAQSVSTWRIACPHCRSVVLLAENDNFFELLTMTVPKAEERPLSPAYLTLLGLLSVIVIGAAVYSVVRVFMR